MARECALVRRFLAQIYWGIEVGLGCHEMADGTVKTHKLFFVLHPSFLVHEKVYGD